MTTTLQPETDYIELNARLNVLGPDGQYQLDQDTEAVRQYFLTNINQNTVFFHNLKEKLDTFVNTGKYEAEFLSLYSHDFIKSVFKFVYGKKFRFKSYMGALKFYTGYAMKTDDNSRYLERYEDRVATTALYLAQGEEDLAMEYARVMIDQVYQPATPTYLNSGKKQRGELVSCFLLRMEDSMNSISEGFRNALQLSKRGGGVAFLLTNIRETGAPIKGMHGRARGAIPIMKIFEDCFSYADQLGARQGAGAVWVNCHHMDLMSILDTKRENADEKIRIKSLSVGVILTDCFWRALRDGKDYYQFSTYDIKKVYGIPMSDIDINARYQELVNNPKIGKKRISAEEVMQTLTALEGESGYPYIMNDTPANEGNPLKNLGRINMSNLCVAGNTLLTTDEGEFEIATKVGQTVKVWNGEVYSETTVVKTGENQTLTRVQLSNDKVLNSTDYHKWYVLDENGQEVETRTHQLVVGDTLSPYTSADGSLNQGITVVSIDTLEGLHDTYCVNEPLRHRAMFNGILTGNCSEILQVNAPSNVAENGTYETIGLDISCNLGSMNVYNVMQSASPAQDVATAIRMLTAVSDMSRVDCSPSILRANQEIRSVGLGQMNLASAFGAYEIMYGSPASVEFTDMYFSLINFYSLRASVDLSMERGIGSGFSGWEESEYGTGEYFDKMEKNRPVLRDSKVKRIFEQSNWVIPTDEDYQRLREDCMKYGPYNGYRQAIAPTGSISYVNNSSSSLHPSAARIEARKEGKTGRVYYPAPLMTNENAHFFEDAYAVSPYHMIDVYAAATRHTDQGLSCTLFVGAETSTGELAKIHAYARSKGIKTTYYVRVRQKLIEGTEDEGCVSCAV